MDQNTSDKPEETQASNQAEKQEEPYAPEKHKEPEKTEHEEAGKQYKEERSGKISLWKEKATAFVKECIRVLKVTKKPDKTEFVTIVKVSGMGILIIGLIGFLVFLIKEVIL